MSQNDDFKIHMVEMYRKFEVVIEKIKVYDKLEASISDLSGKLEELGQKLEVVKQSLTTQLSKNGTNTGILADGIKEQIRLNYLKFSDIQQAHTDFKSQIEEIKADHSSLSDFSNRTHAKLVDHQDNAAYQHSVEALQDDFALYVKESKDIHSKLSQGISSLKDETNKLQSVRPDLESSINELTAKVDTNHELFKNWQASHLSKLSTLSDVVSKNFEYHKNDLKESSEQVNKRFEDLPSIDELAEKLNKRIDLVEMQSQNFDLRFTNSENTIKFLDKKSENHGLRLTKIEAVNKG